MDKTFKEVVEEETRDFFFAFPDLRHVDTQNALSGAERVISITSFLDTFAAKIRQATLAEAREKIEGMRITDRSMWGFIGEVSPTRVEGYNRAIADVLGLLDKDIT